MQVPLIDPKSAQLREQVKQTTATMEALWPLHPFPLGTTPFWMGKTLLDAFAEKAMESYDWRMIATNGPEALEKAVHHCWRVAMAMMTTRPVGTEPLLPTLEAPTTPAGSGINGAPVDSAEDVVTLK